MQWGLSLGECPKQLAFIWNWSHGEQSAVKSQDVHGAFVDC